MWLCVICPKKCLGSVWIENNNPACLAGLKVCLDGFVANSRGSLGLLVWVVFVGIIYATISLEGEQCYYLIGNNMLDIFFLMNVDICMFIY